MQASALYSFFAHKIHFEIFQLLIFNLYFLLGLCVSNFFSELANSTCRKLIELRKSIDKLVVEKYSVKFNF